MKRSQPRVYGGYEQAYKLSLSDELAKFENQVRFKYVCVRVGRGFYPAYPLATLWVLGIMDISQGEGGR